MKSHSAKSLQTLLTRALHNHGAAAKPPGHFPVWGKLLIQTFPQLYATLLLHLFLGWHAGARGELDAANVDMRKFLQPSSLQSCSHTALLHPLPTSLRQMNVMPNAFSFAFGCRKWPLNVVLSPVKLIMAKIGAAQAASELDSVSGSRSAPDRPGNSTQVWVLWVKALLALPCPPQWLCCHC